MSTTELNQKLKLVAFVSFSIASKELDGKYCFYDPSCLFIYLYYKLKLKSSTASATYKCNRINLLLVVRKHSSISKTRFRIFKLKCLSYIQMDWLRLLKSMLFRIIIMLIIRNLIFLTVHTN